MKALPTLIIPVAGLKDNYEKLLPIKVPDGYSRVEFRTLNGETIYILERRE